MALDAARPSIFSPGVPSIFVGTLTHGLEVDWQGRPVHGRTPRGERPGRRHSVTVVTAPQRQRQHDERQRPQSFRKLTTNAPLHVLVPM